MNRFGYQKATSIADAVQALAAQPGAKLVAGGTNLIDLVKYNVETPTNLIDITHVREICSIEETGVGLSIGAMVSNADLAQDERIKQEYPLLAAAILAGASPQLRNAATTGGNLNQRTRCYYFYDTATPCNKREPGSGCPAIGGVNRLHAILGASDHCIAVHPSDMCVALAALEAAVHVSGPDGERTIAFQDYHRLPAEMPQFDTTLLPGEVVTRVVLPSSARTFNLNYTYLKLRDRLSYAFALISVAVALEIEGNSVRTARIALGGVAPKPWRREEAEALLVGSRVSPDSAARAATALLEGARGHQHNMFKVELAPRAIIRAIMQAAAGSPQSLTDKRIA
jgi:xanthine dehydrogenase YagS FAD-binding subunit